MPVVLPFVFLAFVSCILPAHADPFSMLRAAYAARDANAAAATYAPNAEVSYRYDGVPEEQYRGTKAIAASFAKLFAQMDDKQKLDLNFRETSRVGGRIQGLYRLRMGSAPASYGRFDAVVDVSGKFVTDVSSGATFADFEEAPGRVMFGADDETLDRNYYARLTGRYRLPDGCMLIVTRSVVRLFVRNSCTNDWRGLSRQAGRTWTAGDRVRSDKQITTLRFAPIVGSDSPLVEVSNGSEAQTARRITLYRTEDVTFRSGDGTTLAGTVYTPEKASARQAATVMLHGSGPQDRDGYASIIAVLTDELAASGRVVLAFDKRGTGGSGGDGDRAGFDVLAADAIAAMRYLTIRPDVHPARIGLAGSSQAGWVAAKAIADGASPADVFLLGAAGTAMTVAEQNLYNTEVRMRCQKIAEGDIRVALRQQSAFFQFLRDPSTAPKLDALTAQARSRPALRDWLFPDSQNTDRSAGDWYVVLNPTFDPLPVWKRYGGKMLFLFSQYDDSTPTALAQTRLRGTASEVRVIEGSQHLGLVTDSMCRNELTDLSRFGADLMPAVAKLGAAAKP
jgi:pimeloyl-ACP methyl ester carboxylesterase